ncbi:hypothetical protein C6Y40_13115 [Alteromonas alba]|uniref:Bacteriocin n=1 Tax=Alteromonas alba TaxID=2079529 RepID=A0A2S9V9H9_9ALTE|nr:hypothetical protein [Alteromonas alba]PRO73120.1 hypothetical protein C6Y40_13115 [Alteromonas alba]|tara:strand:- start:93 stop:362 length:270 start_codon:yes stop_codon:yes gene_type:complete
MRDLTLDELKTVSGGEDNISFGDAVGMGSFAGGAGAAAAGAELAVVGSAALAGGLIVGSGYAGYEFGNWIGADDFGSWLGGEIYDWFNS